MKTPTLLRIAVFGIVFSIGGLGWLALWHDIYVRDESPGIIVDYAVPVLLRLTIMMGLVLVVASVVCALVTRIRDRIKASDARQQP